MRFLKDIRCIWRITRREVAAFSKRPLFLFTIILGPVFIVIFFTTLMQAGLPTKLPAAIVDEDDTRVTRMVVRILGSMEETNFTKHYKTFSEARDAMQRREIYAFFYIPKGLTEEAEASRKPKVSFYTNEAIYIAGNMLMKDFKTASELAGLALTRENLYAHGATERQALGIIRAIQIETHPINNPSLDYSVYLTNMLVPGLYILLILLSTTYTIGNEWKNETQHVWLRLADGSPMLALFGKLLPQAFLFIILWAGFDVYVYQFLEFPCHCGVWAMIGWGALTVVASQCFGILLFGLFVGQMRVCMCLSSLWGILSFSLAGFTYPVTAMSPILKWMACLFPLRHYYLIYVNQALDGFSIHFVWTSVAALLAFIIVPILVMPRYKMAFDRVKYKP